MYHLELNFATCNRGFPGVSDVNYLTAMHDTRVPSLGQEYPLEKGMAAYSSILVWRIPWTEEPGGLQLLGHKRIQHNLVTNTTHTYNKQNPTKQQWLS